MCGLDNRKDKLNVHFSKHRDLYQADAFALREGEEPLDPVHEDWEAYLQLKGMDPRPMKKRKSEDRDHIP